MRKTPTNNRFLAAVAAAFLLVAASIGATPAHAAGTLIWGLPVGASVLDPHVSCG